MASSAPSPPPAPSSAVPASTSSSLPPHLQTLLGPLAQSPSVLGMLVLARSPAAGQLKSGADAADSSLPGRSDGSSGSIKPAAAGPTIVQAHGAPFDGHQGRLYALRIASMVDAVEGGCVGPDGSGDPLRLLRIRTVKHELLITPDPNYVLVVLHDPAL